MQGCVYFRKGSLILQSRSALERFRLIRILPGELDVVAAEVTVGSSLPVDRFAQAQVTDDRAGAQVKVIDY
jgi:hypothetical protein